jgi:hypothetical protein
LLKCKRPRKRIKTYLEQIDCPKCGLRGDHFLILTEYNFLYHIVLHQKKKYSAQKYANLKKKGIPVNIRRSRASQNKIKTWECYLGKYP